MKPKVIIFINWFLPGYKAGGPIKSVVNIVRTLQDEVDFKIVTSNTDFGEPSPYHHIEPNVWLKQENYQVIYLDEKHQKFSYIKHLLQEEAYDLIYLNSLFSLNYTLLPILARKFSTTYSKIVVAPRGMLGHGALQLKKQKKQIFIKLAKALCLFKSVTWHASTVLEAAEIKAMFGGKANIHVATNIASLAAPAQTANSKNSQNTAFFFLSRISPKKNLLGALEMLTKLTLNNSITFDIIGPVEDEKYWQQCKVMIAGLPSNIVVTYRGAIPNPQLPTLLQHYHFLLLPTFSENYGHVVVESWANNCPVILSDQTPWQNLEKAQVGWNIPLNNKSRFKEVLEKCVLMQDVEFQQMCQHIIGFMNKQVVTAEVIEQNRRLFKPC